MKNNITLNAAMGEQVLQRLASFVDMDAQTTGLVAGQAVASAVSELYGDKTAVIYNDVDVFTRAPVRIPTFSVYEGRVLDTLEQNTVSLGFDYGHLSLSTLRQYTVHRTRRDGLLNEVQCVSGEMSGFLDDDGPSALRFLASFD